MIDKLDLRIPRHTPFTPSFQRKYAELRALEKGPFRPSKFYEYTGDLREYGHNVRLNMYCQMEKVGNHKLEFIDVGAMSRLEILREIGEVFELEPDDLGIMRVDFAVDVPGLPVQWFREVVHAQHKRFRAAVTGEPFYSEMGTGEIQTLYFGKRPNLIRIYDKQAEYRHQYKSILRNLGERIEAPSFESLFPDSKQDSILTRVERQIAQRIPLEVSTLGRLFDSNLAYKPFAKLKIIDHAPVPIPDSSLSFESLCTGICLRNMAQRDGMQAVNAFISRHSNGNASRVREKYRSFLASASESGITGDELHRRFERSLVQQLAS